VSQIARGAGRAQEMRSFHLHVAGGQPDALRGGAQHGHVVADAHQNVLARRRQSLVDSVDQAKLA
jgi:hypothetical protein